jgi:glycosyltransferase involved in cell wall biosynthesis
MTGSDFAFGGVRGHLHAIQRHSALRVQLVPDEEAMGGIDRFTAGIRERFAGYDPPLGTVVHSHVMPWMIRWCGRQQERGLRWIHTYHNMYFPEFARGSLEPWQQEVNEALIHEARHAAVRLAVSRWQQQYLLAEHGIATDYLPNGVDVAACEQGQARRFRRRHQVHGPFILYVGRNDPVKNPAEFVRLAAALPGHCLVMLGQGLEARQINADWQVAIPANLLLLGAASPAEVQDALAACDALVVTSLREGLPTVVLEALVHGKSVIVPNEAGCAEAIGGGECGFIYQPGEIDDLVAQTRAGLADREKAAKGRQRVLAEFDWRVIAGRLDAIYRGAA